MSQNGTNAQKTKRDLFSEEELELLTRLATSKGLLLKEVTKLIELERNMEHMGRRHRIHVMIERAIEEIAERRMRGTST